MVGSTRKGKKVAIEFAKAKKCEGIGAVVSIDVFEVEALGRYLKPQSKVADVSGRAKGNRN